MPGHHDEDDTEPERASRERPIVLRDGTKFTVDLKFAMLILGGAISVSASWLEQKYALKSARYEIQAEIVEVKNAAERDKGDVNNRLTNLEKTTCAIAKKVGAETGCP